MATDRAGDHNDERAAWALPAEQRPDVSRSSWDPLRLARRLTLGQRFALVCLVVLVTGAVIIGELVSREIESGVISRTGDLTALYVESALDPHLSGLRQGRGVSEEDATAFGSLISTSRLGEQVVSLKVWSIEGQVLYATDGSLIGQTFEQDSEFTTAAMGGTASHISHLSHEENSYESERWSLLVETYVPVKSAGGEVTGVIEFYQLPDELIAQVNHSQQVGWLIVGASTVAMYVLLVGLVAGASRTITRQNRGLTEAFAERVGLESHIRGLNQRLRRAADTKVQTDEQVLRRLAQDFHDGPVQDLALALLRIGDIERPDATPEEQELIETIQFALHHSLAEVRSITLGLRLPELDGLPWHDVIEKVAEEHRKRTGSTVHVTTARTDLLPTTSQRIATFRMVQESLSNASKHAEAKEMWVTLEAGHDAVVVSVRDEGIGFDVFATESGAMDAGLGIRGMRERIELLGGDFEISSSESGTTVTARIPAGQGATIGT